MSTKYQVVADAIRERIENGNIKSTNLFQIKMHSHKSFTLIA